MSHAFNPLGVYINFFQPSLKAGSSREFLVKMVNDHAEPVAGSLTLSLRAKAGEVLTEAQALFRIEALGAADFRLSLRIPDSPQDGLVLQASAARQDHTSEPPTLSRRWVAITD
ncbi:MAG: hypothetical protein HUU20_28810 [Pirellulales bacterium]|nr:hypothetical protein [Pirellulales bacterium]